VSWSNADPSDLGLVTIDVLPDDVLVEVFSFYLYVDRSWYTSGITWHALIRVCRRWRYLVFASPRRLNLRLEYYGHAPMSEALDAWPVLPVMLVSSPHRVSSSDKQWDNLVAALESEHYNRICQIEHFNITNSRLERFAEAVQKPFPELTHLQVWPDARSLVPVLPDSFLGGSAPRLQALWLTSIPFPSLPKLLLSANGLVTLTLDDIPDSGYFSPDAMATALTVTTRIEYLELRFRSNCPRPRPDPTSQSLPPPKRFVLPALTEVTFEGAYEYLEYLLSRIDAPLLYDLTVTFFDFMDLNSDIPQLHQLISHARKFKALDRAEVSVFRCSIIELCLYPKIGAVNHCGRLMLGFDDEALQPWSLTQICSSSFPLISTLKELKIMEHDFPSSDHVKGTQWLELLDPFTSLKNLYLTDGIARRVFGAFQGLSGERATEVLPALRNLFVTAASREFEPIQITIEPFIAARQLSGHPVAINHWRI